MAGNWNPSYPAVLGLEWLGHYEVGDDYFGTHSPIRGQILRSTAAETVDAFRLGIMPTVNSALPLFLLLDVYPIAALPANPDDVTVSRYEPDAQVSIGSWLTQAGSGTTIYTTIDETGWSWPLTTAQNADYIRTRATASTQAIFHMNTGAFSLTRRPAKLRIHAVAACKTGFRNIRFALRHVPSGVDYQAPSSLQRTHGYTAEHGVDLGEINPVTLRPWSALDVRAFEAATGTWAVVVQGGGSTTNELQVKALELEVTHVPQDHACRAVWQRPGGAPRSPVLFDDVFRDNGAGGYTNDWSKPSSGDFVFVPRQALALLVTGGGPFATDIRWQFIGGYTPKGPALPPVPGMRATHVSYGNSLGEIWAMSSPEGDLSTSFPPTIKAPTEQGRLDLMVAGVTSNDSQPYGFHHFVKDDEPVFVASGAYPGYYGQVVVPSTTDTWLGVRGILRPPVKYTALGGGKYVVSIPKAGERTARVSVHNGSTGVQMGGFFDLDAAELHASPYIPNMPGYRMFEEFLSASVGLTSGTQYEVRVTVQNGPTAAQAVSDLESWAFRKPDGYNNTGVGGDAGSATFQGDNLATGGFAVNGDIVGGGLFAYSEVDVALQLLEQPDPPEGLVCQVLVQEPPQPDTGCSIPGIQYVHLAWDSPNTYGVNFDRWEVERQGQDDGGAWAVAATSEDHAARLLEDYIPVRNRWVKYRVRALTLGGAFSEWVETDPVTLATYGCEVLFVSNERPDLNVAFDHEPEVDFGFQDADNDELMVVTGSPYQVALVDVTDRGVVVSYTLVANFGAQPMRHDDGTPVGAEQVFEPLRRIARSAFDPAQVLPYVTVLDYLTNRRFAYLKMGNGTQREPGWRYHVPVDVTPLTIVPQVLEIPASAGVALLLPDADANASTPDIAAYAVTDFDMDFVVSMADWTPAQVSMLGGQWENLFGGTQNGWGVFIGTDGQLSFQWTTNGLLATQDSVLTGATLPFVDGTEHKITVQFDVNNGAGSKVLTVLLDDSPWVSVPDAGTTTVHNSTQPLRVGGHSAMPLGPSDAYVRSFTLRASIGGAEVANPDFDAAAEGAPTYTDPATRVWTFNAGAAIVPLPT